MANQIKVSAKVFGESWRRVRVWNKTHKNPPNTVNVNGAEIQWKDWVSAYKNVINNKIGKYTFLQFADSYNRYSDYYDKYKVNPSIIRVNKNNLSWKNWLQLHKSIFNKITVTIKIPSTLVTQKTEDKKITNDTVKTEIIPVYHFNQQTIPIYGEVSCGPVSGLICASAFDLVTRENFQSKAIGIIHAMHTGSNGTTPANMVTGFNNFFKSLNMSEKSFTEKNVEKAIKNGDPCIVNVLTDKTIGYRGNFGHWMPITGYKNGKLGISDPHGFNIGRGYRYWYPFSVIDQVRKNNFGGRPLYVVSKK